MTKSDALHLLRPGAQWIIRGDDIAWLDANQTCPTDAEIEAEVTRLQAEYSAKQYQRQRAAEYPSIPEQFDLLYHGGYDAWKSVIQAVKDKYPKGQA
jgi:hypothetical protein